MHYSEEIDFSNMQETPIATVILSLGEDGRCIFHHLGEDGKDAPFTIQQDLLVMHRTEAVPPPTPKCKSMHDVFLKVTF